MTLAKRLRELRTQGGMSLDDVAAKANISKTYLWELEKDEGGEKKPSAVVLLRIANALSTTIAELLSLPTVKVKDTEVEIPAALQQLQDRLAAQNTPLSSQDLRDLATTRFRARSPSQWMNGCSCI